jgi:hypothetical protein
MSRTGGQAVTARADGFGAGKITANITGCGLGLAGTGTRRDVACTENTLLVSHLGRYPECDVIRPAEPPQGSHTELLSSSGCSSHGPGNRRHRAVPRGQRHPPAPRTPLPRTAHLTRERGRLGRTPAKGARRHAGSPSHGRILSAPVAAATRPIVGVTVSGPPTTSPPASLERRLALRNRYPLRQPRGLCGRVLLVTSARTGELPVGDATVTRGPAAARSRQERVLKQNRDFEEFYAANYGRVTAMVAAVLGDRGVPRATRFPRRSAPSSSTVPWAT